jgi:hypothetical protein
MRVYTQAIFLVKWQLLLGFHYSLRWSLNNSLTFSVYLHATVQYLYQHFVASLPALAIFQLAISNAFLEGSYAQLM